MKNLLIVFCLALGIISCEKDKIVEGTEMLPGENIAKSDSIDFHLTSHGVQGEFLVAFTLDKQEYESSGTATYTVDVFLTDNGSCNPSKKVKFYLDVTVGGIKKVIYNYDLKINTCQHYSSTYTVKVESMSGSYYSDLYFDLSEIDIPWWNPVYSPKQHLKIPYSVKL